MSEKTQDPTNELVQNGGGWRAPLSVLTVRKGFNPRKNIALNDEFINSVKVNGIQNPIHVRNDPEHPGKFIIVDGERRYLAAKKTGQEDIPVVPAGDMDDMDALVLSLVANEGQEGLSNAERAEAFKRLQASGCEEKEIARVMGTSVRTIREALRVIEEGDPEIKKGVIAKDPKDKIAPRAAARAATLPKDEQKKLAGKLKGKSTKDAIKEVQKVEKKLGASKRGRKPRKTPIARDAHARLDMLFYLIASRLRKAPDDERAKGHLEAVLVLQGEHDVLDLYDGNAKAPKKMVTSKTINELAKKLDAEAAQANAKAEKEEKSAKKKASKKVSKLKAKPRTAPANKGPKRSPKRIPLRKKAARRPPKK